VRTFLRLYASVIVDPTEMAAYMDPSGPSAAAEHWLRLVLGDGDIAAAWPLTDENLRRCLTQGLIWDNMDRTRPGRLAGIADALSEAHPIWEEMQRGLLRILRQKWKDAPPLDHLGGLRPRLVDPVHELVFLVDATKQTVIPAGAYFQSVTFLMANRDGQWLVAGFCAEPPAPGWPPTWPREDLQELQ